MSSDAQSPWTAQNDVVLTVRNLSKEYAMYSRPIDVLKENLFGARLAGRRQVHHVFDDVNFEVRKGEAFGIIGKNGAGKSTLLQIICGTLTPTAGSVEVTGKIAALLELGAGFNPEFTGRENIRVSGALYGMTPEQIDERMNDIVAFADIGDYLDEPVKTYSSGMFVRLAFAVIANCDADILVIDEALAVGDVFFTQKCMRFIRSFLASGGSILFVSHDTGTVTALCKRALLLLKDRPPFVGEAEALCKAYIAEEYESPDRRKSLELQRASYGEIDKSAEAVDYREFVGTPRLGAQIIVSPFRPDAESFGEGGATIESVQFHDADGDVTNLIFGDTTVTLRIEAATKSRLIHPALGFMIKDRHGQYVLTDGTDGSFRNADLVFLAGEKIMADFTFDMPNLVAGRYTLNVAIAEGLGHEHIQHHWIHDAVGLEVIGGPAVHGTAVPGHTRMVIRQSKVLHGKD